jgi:hypothetical protein
MHNPARFVPLEGAVGAGLDLEHPLAGDDSGVARSGDQLPCLVAVQCVELLLHSSTPGGLFKGSADGLRDDRHGC